MRRTLFALLLTFTVLPDSNAARPAAGLPDTNRVATLTTLVGPSPFALGPTLSDRAAWEKLAALDASKYAVTAAAKLLKSPLPDTTDDLYLEFSRIGNRGRYQGVYGERINRLLPFTIAECVENQGRYLPALESLITSLCAQKSWVLPAHDSGLAVFQGKTQNPDLVSTELAFELANTLHLLGDKLTPATRDLALKNIRRRVVDPFMEMISGRSKARSWWLTTDNNWNSVCLANSVGAALAVLPSREERGLAAAAGEYYVRNYLAGYGPDGYCVEGLGYWNYGFSRFVRLADLLDQATGGRVDLFNGDLVRQIALFPTRLELQQGIYPAYGDCGVGSRPSSPIMAYVNRRLRLGLPPAASKRGFGADRLADFFQFSALAPVEVTPPNAPLRHWFENAEVLTERPAPGGRLAVSLKGGHGGVNHGHADLGSFVLAVGKEPILLDPGPENYSRRTFSKERWVSKVLNSYGHPVPLVNGVLQTPTSAAVARITTRLFGEKNDVLALDLRSAYAVPGLQKMDRTFTYSRVGAGALTIRDDVRLATPGTFGTALITFGSWKQTAPDTLVISQGGESVTVKIQASGAPFEVKAEPIIEDLPHKRKPTRLGITLTAPVTAGVITTVITPN
jgi:hypothetical protein